MTAAELTNEIEVSLRERDCQAKLLRRKEEIVKLLQNVLPLAIDGSSSKSLPLIAACLAYALQDVMKREQNDKLESEWKKN